MNDDQLIERFTPILKWHLASLSNTLEILASQRAVSIDIREQRVVDPGELPESFHAPCVVTCGEVAVGGVEGETVMVFHLVDVLVIVGLMYMMDEAQILDKLEGGFTEDDADAFGEAFNQAFGALSSVLADAYDGDGDVVTRHVETRAADFVTSPESIGDLVAGSRMLMIEVDLQIAGYDPSEAVFFWPLGVVQQLASGGDAAGGGSKSAGKSRGKADIERVLRLKIPLAVLLARKEMTLGEIMGISIGSVIEFEKSSDELLDFMVGDRKIGAGEAGKMGEKFCLQLKRIGSPAETLRELL